MASLPIVDVERSEILPLNPPANNAYSFREGFPIVQFLIPDQPKLLKGSSMRLNGTLRLAMPASTEAVPVLVDNANNKGVSATSNACLSSRVGVASCLEQITLSSMTHQTLEVVRSYGRYLASVQPVTHSQEDFDTNLQGQSLTASRKLNGALMTNNDVSFSIPLRTGMLSGGQQIPIGTNGIRGMIVELRLAPDSQVLSGFTDATGTAKNNAGDGAGAFYQLRDVSLSYDLLVPDAATSAKMSIPSTGSLTYNAVSHLYSVINSSDVTSTFNLGTSKTLSVFHNFLPTSHLNSYAQDSFETPKLLNIGAGGAYDSVADVSRVSFLRGGVMSPIENEVDVSGSTSGTPQSELITNFISSIKPYSQFNHSLISLQTQSGIFTQRDQEDASDKVIDPTNEKYFMGPDSSSVFGVGVATDPYRVGVDYKMSPYGLRIVSGLDGASPNSLFTYVLAQNTLSYSPSGISVMS